MHEFLSKLSWQGVALLVALLAAVVGLVALGSDGIAEKLIAAALGGAAVGQFLPSPRK